MRAGKARGSGSRNQSHFNRFKWNELLIEDDSPSDIFKDLETGLKYLADSFGEQLFNEAFTFDKIHIFSANKFIYDVFNKQRIVDVSKRNLV